MKMDNATRCEASIVAFFDYLLWIELSVEQRCLRTASAGGPGPLTQFTEVNIEFVPPHIWPRIYITKKSRTVTCHMPVCDLTLSDKGGVYPKERWCETRSRALLLRRGP